MHQIGYLLFMLLQIYIWLLIGRMIISWIPMFAPNFQPRGVIASLFELIYTLTDPPIKAFRQFIPPLRLGGVGLDLAFMAVFIGVYILQRIVIRVFF